MSLTDDLAADITDILTSEWTTRAGQVVPDAPDLNLGNDAVQLDATVLYADLAQSTTLVDTRTPDFAAAIYKVYLRCACRIIRANKGTITAFDGDRVMAVFIGDRKNTSAVRTALQINNSVITLINPAIANHYPRPRFALRQAVGIDTGPLWVARTGIRSYNDLVWVGPAANYAAKLCSLRQHNFASWITHRVFTELPDDLKYGKNRKAIWLPRPWPAHRIRIYGSNWVCSV